MTLESLSDKLSSIAVNSGGLAEFDFFLSLQEFFSQDEIKDKMLEANKDRLYHKSETSEGRLLPRYADKTAKHKRRIGLPYTNYTYYETGETYDSLEVIPEEEMVGIYPSVDAPEYVEALDGEAWGLTEKDIEDVVTEDMKDFVSNRFNEFING